MIEHISLVQAAPIVMMILDKFWDGVGSKLGELAVDKFPEKVKQLGQFVWEKCLRGKTDTDKLLEGAANGLEEEQKKLEAHLSETLTSDPSFNQEVKQLATEIYQAIQEVDAHNVQQVYGGQGLQVNDPKAPVIQAGKNAKFYFGVQSPD
jgi:hypothetical protein